MWGAVECVYGILNHSAALLCCSGAVGLADFSQTKRLAIVGGKKEEISKTLES
jgi:hypothetical protein